MRRINLFGGILSLLFGLFVVQQSSVTLSRGTLANPGPGFFPFWLGMSLLCLSALLIIPNLGAAASTEAQHRAKRTKWYMVVIVLGSLLGVGLFIEKLGYLVTTFLLTGILCLDWERRNWKATLLTAALITLACYFAFVVLLKIRLPKGWFGL